MMFGSTESQATRHATLSRPHQARPCTRWAMHVSTTSTSKDRTTRTPWYSMATGRRQMASVSSASGTMTALPAGINQSAQTTCTDNVHRQRAQTTCIDEVHRQRAQTKCTDRVHRDPGNPHFSTLVFAYLAKRLPSVVHPPDWACKLTGLVGRSSCAPTSCAPACWKDVRLEL